MSATTAAPASPEDGRYKLSEVEAATIAKELGVTPDMILDVIGDSYEQIRERAYRLRRLAPVQAWHHRNRMARARVGANPSPKNAKSDDLPRKLAESIKARMEVNTLER